MKQPLNTEDFNRAAARLGCLPAAIEAVASVESRDSGFNPDDSPKTLFEGHVFHRLTHGRFASMNPTLSYPKWSREFYGRRWQDEAARLRAACQLDNDAALMSTSWGKFQIMGFNFAAAGFSTLSAFVDAMRASEAAQLDAFVTLIQTWEIDDELRDRRWERFALVYNGPKQAENHYSDKMARAFALSMHARGLLA